jgi:CRISPR system Cascade subunit CasA
MYSFNLIDREWIPCLRPDGARQLLSIRDVLAESHHIARILAGSPLVTVGVHRLLLAFLHRVLDGPKNWREWRDLWQNGKGKWDMEAFGDYFRQWHQRFELFHPQLPFYQTADLPFRRVDKKGKDRPYEVTAAKLAHQLASGNEATLFDHTVDANPPALSAAEAAALVVACQAFALGGLLTHRDGEDPRTHKSADAAPLAKGAVAILQGANLFQTLMLNLHHFSYDDEEPFHGDPQRDAPAWERRQPTQARDRPPDGYLDWLTWQSRRIRLHPSGSPDDPVVTHVVLMKGEQLPSGMWRHDFETMLAFTRDLRAGAPDPWPPVAFREGRAIWRDSLALFQSIAEQRRRPKTLTWLDDLASKGVIPRSATYPLGLLGLCADRAKALLWRHETLPLAISYLGDEGLLGALDSALQAGEDAAAALRGALENLATIVLGFEGMKLNKNQRAERDNFVKSLNHDSRYWPKLESPFRAFLLDLPKRDDPLDALGAWAQDVCTMARDAMRQIIAGLDHSPRMLRAIYKGYGTWGAQKELNVRLSKITQRFQEAEGEVQRE